MKKLAALAASAALLLSAGVVFAGHSALVGRWHFNKDAKDSSGYHNDGTVNGTTLVNGQFGRALEFNGVDDYVEITAPSSLAGISDITLQAWIKPDSKQNGGIISNDITYSSKKGYDFFLWVAGGIHGRLYIDFGNGNTLGRIWWDIPDSEWYGEWHHVAATWDREHIYLYVDGVEVSDVSYFGTYSDPAKPTLIGAINYLDPAHYYYDGFIDEVRIWDCALTAEEIAQHAKSNSSAAPSCQ